MRSRMPKLNAGEVFAQCVFACSPFAEYNMRANTQTTTHTHTATHTYSRHDTHTNTHTRHNRIYRKYLRASMRVKLKHPNYPYTHLDSRTRGSIAVSVSVSV